MNTTISVQRLLKIQLLLLFFVPSVVFANTDLNNQTIDWFTMTMWLFGGLSLFLYGMEKMIKGLLVVAGDRMKEMLSKLTSNRVMGAITGAGVTAVIQSSSVTSVLAVGSVSAVLMSPGQAAGVITTPILASTVYSQI